MDAGTLLVAGTTSDAGKSLVAAGICRWLSRQGVRVAPFKALNMSNHSVVTPEGGEIGRAQALQAAACGLEPSVRFNPVLLKPGSRGRTQLVVLGRVVDELTSGEDVRPRLAAVVRDTLAGLRVEYDVVVCEGAGSPTEINLRADDLANLGLARAAGIPVIVVGDIDRGGAFAALFGTLALLAPADQALVAGFVVNKFRGDHALLRPGLEMLRGLTGRPVLGTIPWLDDLWLDAEDALSFAADGVLGRPRPPLGTETLRVAVPRLPAMSNPTDLDPLAAEPGVEVRLVSQPAAVHGADLVVLPGSKSTVDDLAWLRGTGLADAVTAHAAAGGAVLGLCGGFQMMAERIADEVESRAGEVPGLGLVPMRIEFGREKVLGRARGSAFGAAVHGYEIHHGRVGALDRTAVAPLVTLPDGTGEGVRHGAVYGTHWHGILESDAFRRAFLAAVADVAARPGFAVAPDTRFAGTRAAALDTLGDAVERHLDTAALWNLIEHGAPVGLPFVPPGAPSR